MRITKLSPKQGQIFGFIDSPDYALICDGAVRSGKTLAMITAYVIWAMDNFENCNFAICGKTVQSAERNILKLLMEIKGLPYSFKYKISNKALTVSRGKKKNTFYIFGGKDESSYTLIQGLTLAGVLFDEVALMPRSFVDQAIARTLSYANAKLWFNCNPDAPTHWFYLEWLKKPKKGVMHLHFLMPDNPILTDAEIKKAEAMFTGVFRQKYIEGLWVRAEGTIFKKLAEHPEEYMIPRCELPKRFEWQETGFDIGGNGSAYAMVTTALGYDGTLYVLRSRKKQAQDVDTGDVQRFVFGYINELERDYKFVIERCHCDHIDVLINTLNKTRYIFDKTYKPPLEDRVFLYAILMASGRLKFVEGECEDLIEEMKNLVYAEGENFPLDDGSMQIDTYDAFTYSIAGNWFYLNDENFKYKGETS